jgi:complex iron-sulfur molybdoenzyme family reductase subunit gamma
VIPAAIRGFVRRRGVSLGVIVAVLGSAAVLQFTGVNPAASQTATLAAFTATEDPGLDPSAAVWQKVPWLQVPLTAQQGSYAAGGGSIPVVSARAVHFEDKLYVRVEWADTTRDDTTTKVENFSDAVAVEFPSRSAASVPSLCMGQADSGVNIWQWRADSQAGLKDPIGVYAAAYSDEYRPKEALFYTARDAGNLYANPDLGPVQTLVSHTFGTLSPAGSQDVHGQGVYADGHWAVVFTRSLGSADPDQASFVQNGTTDMAFAVWNGSQGDRNGRKSVSQFVRLSLSGTQIVKEQSNALVLTLAIGMLAGSIAVGAGLAWYGSREGGK